MVIKIRCREIIAKKLMSDSEIEKKEGNFCDEKCLKKLIKDDCDVYRLDDQGNKVLLAKFRKKVIPGDTLIIESKVNSFKRGVAKGVSEATVNGEFACSADFVVGIPNVMEKFRPDNEIS